MPVYLALLRGINVSGQKLIKMEDLRNRLGEAGFSNVKTYIQSGNVVFESPEKDTGKLAASLEASIEKAYGFDVTVFVLTAKELEAAIDNNPFTKGREEESSGFKKLYVTFLSDEPYGENLEKLRQAPIGNDKIEVVGRVLYFSLDSNASNLKLSNNLIESKLKLRATTRNWNTTLKLLRMLQV